MHKSLVLSPIVLDRILRNPKYDLETACEYRDVTLLSMEIQFQANEPGRVG